MELLQSAITIVLFLAILGSLVVIHELGHFVTARLARIRVLEFGIGFPPRARVLRSEGETLYTLNWLPIGGFVRLEGEDGDSDDPRAFARAPLLVRLLVLVAGVVMNLLLAFVIFFGIAWLATPTGRLSFTDVQAGSPAAGVGLRGGDAILTVDGRRYDFFQGPQALLDDLRGRAGEAAQLTVRHTDGTVSEVAVTLRTVAEIDAQHGALGIAGLGFEPAGDYITQSPTAALGLAWDRTAGAFRLILDGLGQLAGSIIRNPTEAPPVTGPVGIAVQVGQVFWQLGLVFTLYLAGILSANLALVNILPLPPLDGGRMAVLVLQRVAGNRISQGAERLTYLVGFVFLFGFLIWITYFDVLRQIGVVGGQ